MKVLKFPEERNLESQVKDLIEEMNEIHDTLRRAYDLTYHLEESLEGKEEIYTNLLNRYCNCVGAENVPIHYFDYAIQGLNVDADTGEIIFTPWSEDDET